MIELLWALMAHLGLAANMYRLVKFVVFFIAKSFTAHFTIERSISSVVTVTVFCEVANAIEIFVTI